MTYFGDCENNVTYDLMRAFTKLGGNFRCCCPNSEEFMPKKEVINECMEFTKIYNSSLKILHDPKEAATVKI